MIDSRFTKLLLFFTLYNYTSEASIFPFAAPPRMRLPPAIHPTPETDLIAATYQSLINQTETHQTLHTIQNLESRNLLYLGIPHLKFMQQRLSDHRPLQHDAFYYFFDIIITRIKFTQERKKAAFEQQFNILQTDHALSEQYLKGIISTFLKQFFTLPRYQTAEEQDNLVKERSCAICQVPISDIPESASNIRVVSVMAPCNHFFCHPCHAKWEKTAEYQSRCPLCRKKEDKIYHFHIRSDTSSHI